MSEESGDEEEGEEMLYMGEGGEDEEFDLNNLTPEQL